MLALFGKFVVKSKVFIIVLSLVLIIPALFGIFKTKINCVSLPDISFSEKIEKLSAGLSLLTASGLTFRQRKPIIFITEAHL
ncbi:hypothetical protein B4135_2730 [Caldibacillus debilis]|uniref:Uncharacterized protein n=1 Tax=Caldibacillus debilis TaxID=301148 RepID=A0A150LTB3_9BACI|nr:hypothetical protein B4135_2730 [Caldibacillus debilis]MBO2482677.1 hypothetical protein [Bacillaceae bacterium]